MYFFVLVFFKGSLPLKTKPHKPLCFQENVPMLGFQNVIKFFSVGIEYPPNVTIVKDGKYTKI